MPEDDASTALRRPSPSNRCVTLAEDRTDEWKCYNRTVLSALLQKLQYITAAQRLLELRFSSPVGWVLWVCSMRVSCLV